MRYQTAIASVTDERELWWCLYLYLLSLVFPSFDSLVPPG